MGRSDQVLALDYLHWSADALDRLEQLRGARDHLDWLIEQAVIECRTNAQQTGVDDVTDAKGDTTTREATTVKPIPWVRIGDALGMSRQSAFERFRYSLD